MLMLSVAGLKPALTFGMLLATGVTPIGSAAAISWMLAMRPRLALILSIVPTIAASLTIPVSPTLSGLSASTDLLALIVRLTVIVGVAALISGQVLRFRARSRGFILDATAAAAGVSAISAARACGEREATDALSLVPIVQADAQIEPTIVPTSCASERRSKRIPDAGWIEVTRSLNLSSSLPLGASKKREDHA